MVDILNFSIFDLVGLGDITGIELIFATSALIGGILFTLYFFLLMVGGIATDIFDGLFGLDVDMGADASFKALTFQGIMAFLMFFGLGGLYVLRTDSDATSLAVFAGSVCGGISMYGTGKLFELFVDLQQDGTIEMEDSIGGTGQVYLRIPADGVGQVTIEVSGALRTYNAKSEEGVEIATDDFVQVVGVLGEVLVVKKA